MTKITTVTSVNWAKNCPHICNRCSISGHNSCRPASTHITYTNHISHGL